MKPPGAADTKCGREKKIETDTERSRRLVDSERFKLGAAERIEADIHRERLPFAQVDAALASTIVPNTKRHQSDSYKNVGWNVAYWVYPAGRCARSISSPHGNVVGRPKSS